jgi:hypothetical protein
MASPGMATAMMTPANGGTRQKATGNTVWINVRRT